MEIAPSFRPYAASVAQRFESYLRRLQRPQLHEYMTDSPDFYRWYEYGGSARTEPLTLEQLSCFLQSERGYTEEGAREAAMVALPAVEWLWFKEQFEIRFSSAPVWHANGTPIPINH